MLFEISRNAFKHWHSTLLLKQNNLFWCRKDTAKVCFRYLLRQQNKLFCYHTWHLKRNNQPVLRNKPAFMSLKRLGNNLWSIKSP